MSFSVGVRVAKVSVLEKEERMPREYKVRAYHCGIQNQQQMTE